MSFEVLKAACVKITYLCFLKSNTLEHRNVLLLPKCWYLNYTALHPKVTLIQIVFAYKSTSVPMLGSGGKSVHIVRLGTRLICQLHAPSTLSEKKVAFWQNQ